MCQNLWVIIRNCLGYSFDGASVMAGVQNGVAAIYAWQQGINIWPMCIILHTDWISLLSNLPHELNEASPVYKRKFISLKPICTTRWHYHYRSSASVILTLRALVDSLIILFGGNNNMRSASESNFIEMGFRIPFRQRVFA